VNGAPPAVPWLDEAAGARHYDVHVGVAGGVLGVVEIEHRHTADVPTDTAATKSLTGSPVTSPRSWHHPIASARRERR
jgi:hypothetical protein